MAAYTQNYNLKKPEVTDNYSVEDFNGNMDIIDDELKKASQITVDSALSDTSTNPVQNKVIKAELDKKVNAEENKGLSTNDYTTAEKNKVANTPTNVNDELAKKVDKVTGKGLSTNDYTNGEKSKVANLPSNTVEELTTKAPAYTYGTEDLTAGTSPLETGTLHFVYE